MQYVICCDVMWGEGSMDCWGRGLCGWGGGGLETIRIWEGRGLWEGMEESVF